MSFPTTPSQTVGPYFAIGLPWDAGPLVVPPDTPGAIQIAGIVYDGKGEPVPDSLIETWQADLDGRFADLHDQGGSSQLPGFRGFARCGTEEGDGRFQLVGHGVDERVVLLISPDLTDEKDRVEHDPRDDEREGEKDKSRSQSDGFGHQGQRGCSQSVQEHRHGHA